MKVKKSLLEKMIKEEINKLVTSRESSILTESSTKDLSRDRLREILKKHGID